MKINIALLSIAVFAFTFISGCHKGGYGVAYSMKATIGSNTYEAPNCIARPSGANMVIYGMNNTDVNATKPSIPYISITIVNWHEGLDTFYFDSTLTKNTATYFASSTQYSFSKTGEVYINTVNADNISGVFQVVCSDGSKITDGSFTAKRLDN